MYKSSQKSEYSEPETVSVDQKPKPDSFDRRLNVMPQFNVQLSTPPSNLRRFSKLRKSRRKTLSFSDSISQRFPDSSIRQDSLCIQEHGSFSDDEKDEDTGSTLSENVTVTEEPSRAVKLKRISDREHPNPPAIPGIDSPCRRKTRTDRSLGPTATSDDGDSAEFDSRQSPLFTGNKEAHHLTYRVPSHKTTMLKKGRDSREEERRKYIAREQCNERGDTSDVSKVSATSETPAQKDRVKISLVKRGIIKVRKNYSCPLSMER